MKLTGIIKEHSSHLKIVSNSESFEKFRRIEYEETEKGKILNYLKNGISISSTMILLYSLIPTKKNTTIGGLIFLTDGEWIWPNYLEYYVREWNVKLEDTFVNHMKFNNYVVKNVNENEKELAIEYLKRVVN